MKSNIIENSFGTYDNVAITEYTLTNPSGMEVGIINYGGTITNIIVPDKNGNKGNVVLRFRFIERIPAKRQSVFWMRWSVAMEIALPMANLHWMAKHIHWLLIMMATACMAAIKDLIK